MVFPDLSSVPDHEIQAMIRYHRRTIERAEQLGLSCEHNKEWLPVYEKELERRGKVV